MRSCNLWSPAFLTICLLTTFQVGCGPHPSSSNASTELKTNIGLDLTHVSGFIIAPASNPSDVVMHDAVADAGELPNQLYALGADGTLTVATVTELPDGGQSSSSTQAEPLGIFNTRNYVFLAYNGVTHDSNQCEFVLLRKSDGALYCVDGVPPYQTPMVPFSFADNWVEADSTGDIVWMDYGGSASLVKLSNPADVTVTQAVATNVSSGQGGQAVNALGDNLVMGLAGSLPYLRVQFPAGGFFNVTADMNIGCIIAGASTDPNDLYYSDNTSWETAPSLMKLTWTAPNTFTSGGVQGSQGVYLDCIAGAARTSTHLLFSHATGPGSVSNAQFIDLANDVATVQTASPLTSTQKLAACDTTAFLLGTDAAGNGGIVAYDPASATVSTLLTPGDYSLTAMDVASTCEVTFYGQRASDGAFILGNIPAGGGQVSVVATGFPTVTQIQRIN